MRTVEATAGQNILKFGLNRETGFSSVVWPA
jgi:hypothetical protein